MLGVSTDIAIQFYKEFSPLLGRQDIPETVRVALAAWFLSCHSVHEGALLFEWFPDGCFAAKCCCIN